MTATPPRNVDGWILAIDFGTSFTTAAIRSNGRTALLEIDGHGRFPSGVFLAEDGTFIVGQAAEDRASLAPARMERTPKEYLEVGQDAIPLGGELRRVTDLVAAVLSVVWEEALRQHGRVEPLEVRLTYPASWRERRKELLRVAARSTGISEPRLLSEPEAAAIHLTSERITGEPIGDGAFVAVYDLGGGTFDTVVLRRVGEHFELVGEPGGDDRIGGELFDDRLYRHLGDAGLTPEEWSGLQTASGREWLRANYAFRRHARDAKEAISRAAMHPLFVPAPVDRELLITREAFEDLIRDDIFATLDILDETIRNAGLTSSDLSALYLVGGSSRIPLVAHLVRERFGRADFKGDPKSVVALGAAHAELDRATNRARARVAKAPDPRPSTTAAVTARLGRRPRRIALLLTAAIMLGLAGWFAVRPSPAPAPLAGGQSTEAKPLGPGAETVPIPTPTPPAPTEPTIPSPPTDEEKLLAQVPREFADSCEPTKEVPFGAAATVNCAPTEGADWVQYTQYESKAFIERKFDSQLQNFDVLGTECLAAAYPEHSWKSDLSEGSVLCYEDSWEPTVTIEWTDSTLNIYSIAQRSDGEIDALRKSWEDGDLDPSS